MLDRGSVRKRDWLESDRNPTNESAGGDPTRPPAASAGRFGFEERQTARQKLPHGLLDEAGDFGETDVG